GGSAFHKAQTLGRTAAAHAPGTAKITRAAGVHPPVGPVYRRPAETPFGGLPPPFPTSPSPQGDPEGEVGNGSGKWWLRQAAGEKPPRHQAHTARFLNGFSPAP